MEKGNKRKTAQRSEQTPPNARDEVLRRLQTLEEQSCATSEPGSSATNVRPSCAKVLDAALPTSTPATIVALTLPRELAVEADAPTLTICQSEDMVTYVADRLLTAISRAQVRSYRYFGSDCDPSVHDFEMWCDEVERDRILSNWDDRNALPCLALVIA